MASKGSTTAVAKPTLKISSLKLSNAKTAAKPIVAKKAAIAKFPNTNQKSPAYKAPRPASVNPTVKGI